MKLWSGVICYIFLLSQEYNALGCKNCLSSARTSKKTSATNTWSPNRKKQLLKSALQEIADAENLIETKSATKHSCHFKGCKSHSQSAKHKSAPSKRKPAPSKHKSAPKTSLHNMKKQTQQSTILGQSLSTEDSSLYLLHNNEIEVFSDDTVTPIEMVVITTIIAINDQTSKINYSLPNSEDSDVFQINDNGKISLRKRPVLGFYHLTVHVQDEKQNTTCSVLIFFKSFKPTFTVTAGKKTENWSLKEFKDKKKVPIYIMVGWEPILAFDVQISFKPSISIDFVSSDYSLINPYSNYAKRLVGVIGYSNKKRGFLKIAEINLSVPGNIEELNFEYFYYNIIDQSLSQMKTMPGCQNKILFDIHKDCQFDISDVARLNYYQNVYKTVVVNSNNSVMDTDLNGVIDAQDVINIYDIYVGNSVALLKTQVIEPSNFSECNLIITGETQYMGISSWIKPNSKMFAVFTYPSSVVHDQLMDSNLRSNVLFYKFSWDSNIKYTDAIEMIKSGNIYSLNISNWPVRAENVGISVYFYPSVSLYFQGNSQKAFYAPRKVTSTFIKKFNQNNEILEISMDGAKEKSILRLESSFNPNQIISSVRSESCRNPPVAPKVSNSIPSGSIHISANKFVLFFSIFCLKNVFINLVKI